MVVAPMTGSQSAIGAERKGYGRGLILGLTMAETFLLLVFCLLLVAAAAISAQHKAAATAISERDTVSEQLRHAERENQRLQAEVERLDKTNAKLEQTISALPPDVVTKSGIDDDWREITLAKDLVSTLSNAGISVEEAKALSKALQVLKEKGFLQPGTGTVAERLKQVFSEAQNAATQKPHTWPPIINLSEAGGYYFAVGSAELSPAFQNKLKGDIPALIAKYLKEYQVDVVEVIGHTDEQPLAGLSSNLDGKIGDVLSGKAPISDLKAADNAGLGLARAIAVTQVLRQDPRLSGASILPLSGAELIMPGDKITDGKHPGDVESRRRIEIRIRRRSDQVAEK